jgi:FdrA protein
LTDRLIVRRGAYHDSVTLMMASRDAEGVSGVEFAASAVATPVNLELLAGNGFDTSDQVLGPNDLIIAIRAIDESAADKAVALVDERLAGVDESLGATERITPRSMRSAARRNPESSVAFISVPGRYAAYEAATALEAGLDVFCFSDGLSLDEERALKERALKLGRLMLGADCGTAIIDGVGLGFANAVARGNVGVIGASGTGIQQVTCLLDGAGVGVSHAIGVGGRDLSARVGGLMTMRALELLGDDADTECIVLISKPPDPLVAKEVAAAAGAATKPVVLGLLGLEDESIDVPESVFITTSLEDAASHAARIVGGQVRTHDADPPEQRTPGSIRGLFCGGSLCFEVQGEIGERALPRDFFIDFGADEMTEGRAHPMIDPTLRNDAFERAAGDPAVGAIVLDVVLGYGAHDDPAGDLAPRIEKHMGHDSPPQTLVIALCGTRSDPQGMDEQARRLRSAGAIVTANAAHAARLAMAAVGDRE